MLPLIVLRLRSASKAIVRDAGLGVSRVRGSELPLDSLVHFASLDNSLTYFSCLFCIHSFCAFIFLQSAITNRIANFEVSPDSITSAQCSEASCEAGNPGPFVACSGSNRRKMNIKSDILRPSREQCTIVDVERTVDPITGDIQNDWGLFFGTN
jgi:hypothetical protein